VSRVLHGSGSGKSPAGVRRDSGPTAAFCPGSLCLLSLMPGAGVTAVVIPQDHHLPHHFLHHDVPHGQGTGTDGDYRYGYPYRKHSTGLCGTRMGAGVKVRDRGGGTGSDVLVPCKTLSVNQNWDVFLRRSVGLLVHALCDQAGSQPSVA